MSPGSRRSDAGAAAGNNSRLVQWCRTVFYWEGWLLLVTGSLMLAAPDFVLTAQGFSAAAVKQPVAQSALMQFGECVHVGPGCRGSAAEAEAELAAGSLNTTNPTPL